MHPVSLATTGNYVLVADANRSDMLGTYGAVVEFDARSSNGATPIGGLFTDLSQSELPRRLSPGLKAIATGPHALMAMDDQGIYGFMLDSRDPLDLGNSIATPGQAIALSSSTLYVAEGSSILRYSAMTFKPDPASPSLPVAAQALTVDASGDLFVATSAQILGFTQDQQTLAFDGKGTDGTGPGFEGLAGVAIDPRNGDIYALDRHAVLRFDSQGHFLSRFGQDRIGNGASIAIDQEGDLFVLDSLNNQVLQFEPGR